VFKNWVLRRIFGPKREEVARGRRRPHNEELENLYASPYVIRAIKSRRMRWARHVEQMGERRNTYEILAGKPEGKSSIGRPSCRWEDNTKRYIREIGWEVVDWMHPAG
jgi:hypothetical protein